MPSKWLQRKALPYSLLIAALLTITVDAFTDTSVRIGKEESETELKKQLETILTQDPRIEESQRLARELIKEYPPDKFVVVGLGRTTGVTGEWMRQLSGRDNYFVDAPIEHLKNVLNTPHENKLWKSILPSPEALNGRRIVIHRVLWNGSTMGALIESLNQHLKQRNSKEKTVLHLAAAEDGFGHGNFERRWKQVPDVDERLEYKLRWISDSTHDQFEGDLRDESYPRKSRRSLSFTELGKFAPAEPEEFIARGLRPNQNYLSLKNEIKARDCVPLLNSL